VTGATPYTLEATSQSDPAPEWSRGTPEPVTHADRRSFTVAIIDEQPVTRAGMEQVVSQDAQLVVLESVPDVDELAASGTVCDVVVLALPARAAGPPLTAISKVADFGRPVVTASWEQPPTLLAVLRTGARGCLTRYSEQRAVLDALHVVGQGGVYLCPLLVDQFHAELNQPQQDDPGGLAPREIETLRWIALGFTQSQIASRMGLSQATVNTYAKRIRAKLKVGNKAELTRIAIELGYLRGERRHVAA
jgi:DNA-binding NarL/FixJ family response regulator